MFIATLIANPKEQNLTESNANDFVQALGGHFDQWLAPDIACDILLDHMPMHFHEIWVSAQKKSLDLVIQPRKGRRKKILLADMDSTIIQQECIDELADLAGVGQQVAEITKQAMNGQINFEVSLHKRVRLLSGISTDIIQQVLNTRISLMPGAIELLSTMRKKDAYCALISGGFVDFTQVIARQLGFNENRANQLIQKHGIFTGEVKLPILGRNAKVDALNDITKKLGLCNEDVIAVGDGDNDLGMLTLAGRGVALHAKPIVAKQCNTCLNFADLTGILYIQGYAKSEFSELHN